MPEELLVDRKAVEKLRRMGHDWACQKDDYTIGVGAGIRFALITLGLDEDREEKI